MKSEDNLGDERFEGILVIFLNLQNKDSYKVDDISIIKYQNNSQFAGMIKSYRV